MNMFKFIKGQIKNSASFLDEYLFLMQPIVTVYALFGSIHHFTALHQIKYSAANVDHSAHTDQQSDND